MADETPTPGPSLLQRMRPGRPGLALLAAAIGLIPPLLVPAGRADRISPAPPRAVAPAARPVSPGEMLSALARHLAPAETLHLATLASDGMLAVEIDTADPQALRARLAADPRLAGLATVAETIVADAGLRVRLARPGRPIPAAPPVDPANAADAARRLGLLVERAAPTLAVSGPEAGVMAFVSALGRASLDLAPWRIEQAGDAVRLTGTLVRRATPAAIPPLSRALFADAPPAPVADAPELVGIAGRLGRDAVALVRDPDGGVAPVAVGGSTGGWRLDTLSADAALFSRGDERIRVAMPTGE